jgi:uncharacterized protein (DUF3820 family)
MRKTYQDFKETKIPFGKYKGQTLKNIPQNYLEWVVMNHSDRGICEMCSVELQRRNISWRK